MEQAQIFNTINLFLVQDSISRSVCRALGTMAGGEAADADRLEPRRLRCNYSMGRCEMLREVARLDKGKTAERTRKLASDDWSAFPRHSESTPTLAS